MEIHDLILEQEDATLLDQSLARFIQDTGVRLTVLMGRDGYPLSKLGGDWDQLEVDSLCALSVGAFASSEALARLAGEDTFHSIYHQGVRSHVYISLVGESHLLLTVFDYNASAPLVRLQARVAAENIIAILTRAYARTRAARVTPAGDDTC